MRNYRKAIEAILLDLTGREMRIICTGENAPRTPPPRPRPAAGKAAQSKDPAAPKPEPADILQEVAPAERASLKKAFDVFGANVVGVEDTASHDTQEKDASPADDGADIYGDGAIPLPEDGDVPLPTEEDE